MSGDRTFQWDEAKAAGNEALHRVSFEDVVRFDFEAAVIRVDGRRDYGETRMVAIGPVADRLHVLVYANRGPAVRVISFRKANLREVARYEQEVLDP